MTLEQLESSVLELKPEERKTFVRWFEEHRGALAPSDEDDELTPEQQAAVIRFRTDCARQRLEALRASGRKKVMPDGTQNWSTWHASDDSAILQPFISPGA